MTSPIYDFVKKYAESGTIRAHMPGHKGICSESCGFSSAYNYDITEICGADYLFASDGIIAESEKNASELFGTAETIYSAAGSTACIQAMLASVCRPGDTVAAARNSHIAFINACALLGLEVEWIYPESLNKNNTNGIISGDISPDSAETAIENSDPVCVYITSPDYLGHFNDIAGISEVCRRHGKYLLCDNAHGAYTAFLSPSLHPIHLGADICCDSAHKTLPVLTGGAYLHVGNIALIGRTKKNMSMFCSTSPSYLIMQSLDLCNKYLADDFPRKLDNTVKILSEIKCSLSDSWEILDSEPLKLVLYTPPHGYTGDETADILRKNGVECEYSDHDHIVMMFTPNNTDIELYSIEKILKYIPAKEPPVKSPDLHFSHPKKALSLREAVFAESEFIPADDIKKAVGRICGKTVYCCPPGIAAAVPGEIISEETAEMIRIYGNGGINCIV